MNLNEKKLKGCKLIELFKLYTQTQTQTHTSKLALDITWSVGFWSSRNMCLEAGVCGVVSNLEWNGWCKETDASDSGYCVYESLFSCSRDWLFDKVFYLVTLEITMLRALSKLLICFIPTLAQAQCCMDNHFSCPASDHVKRTIKDKRTSNKETNKVRHEYHQLTRSRNMRPVPPSLLLRRL